MTELYNRKKLLGRKSNTSSGRMRRRRRRRRVVVVDAGEWKCPHGTIHALIREHQDIISRHHSCGGFITDLVHGLLEPLRTGVEGVGGVDGVDSLSGFLNHIHLPLVQYRRFQPTIK